MIRCRCPECGEKLEMEDRMAGRRIRCDGCDARIDVPDDDDDDRPRRRPRDDDDEDDDRGRRPRRRPYDDD